MGKNKIKNWKGSVDYYRRRSREGAQEHFQGLQESC